MSAAATGEATAQTQQVEQKYAQPLAEVSTVASPACALSHETDAEAITKLQAIIAELQANETYLKKLFASSEVQNSDVKNQKGRIKSWLNTISKMLNYLNNGSDAATVKITNYCDKFLPADLEHKHSWRHATLPLAGGPIQMISDEQQVGPILSPDQVDFQAGPGVLANRGVVIKVTAVDASGGDKIVYFQTFKVRRGSSSPIFMGVQVQAPASGAVDAERIIDRHRFGHKIRIPGGETFLVSSHDDLGISK